jgi:hypothetical protein
MIERRIFPLAVAICLGFVFALVLFAAATRAESATGCAPLKNPCATIDCNKSRGDTRRIA